MIGGRFGNGSHENQSYRDGRESTVINDPYRSDGGNVFTHYLLGTKAVFHQVHKARHRNLGTVCSGWSCISGKIGVRCVVFSDDYVCGWVAGIVVRLGRLQK